MCVCADGGGGGFGITRNAVGIGIQSSAICSFGEQHWITIVQSNILE